MRTFTYSDDKSSKFWNIELTGSEFTVTYGKVGTKGQTQTKSFADEAKAQKEYDKLVKEKVGKGYVETT
jgi:predicted DNA-binding WGR domain protein